jgi:AcrR family transcriptional regulator
MAALSVTEQRRNPRRRIVAAAAEVGAEKGALGASLDEVGARATASRSQPYHYCDDKADLLRAVAAATNDTVIESQRALFAGLVTWAGGPRWADALVESQKQRSRRGGCPHRQPPQPGQLIDRGTMDPKSVLSTATTDGRALLAGGETTFRTGRCRTASNGTPPTWSATRAASSNGWLRCHLR